MSGLRRTRPSLSSSGEFPLSTKSLVVKVVLFAALALAIAAIVPVPTQSFKETFIYETVRELPASVILQLDAILVLGGGAPRSVEDPPSYTKARCDFAALVVQERRRLDHTKDEFEGKSGGLNRSLDVPVLCLSAGTAHVSQLLAEDGLPIWESTSSAAYLQTKHNLSNLFVETTSYDTIGNAFYTRTSHTDLNGWRNLLIITSDFHMARTKAIFDWVFLTVEPRLPYKLTYLASRNTGLSEDALQARYNKEQESLRAVHDNARKYRTMKELYTYMAENHALYTASKLVERARARADSGAKALIARSYGGR